MTTDWWSRIASTQFLILYPIQSATVYHTQTGLASWITISFVIVGGLMLNYTFVKDLFHILTSHRPLRELFKEYIWVAIVALMNVSLFASFYHMFGVIHDGTTVRGDWYNSLYFSVVTWTTLGYGDFTPVESMRMVAALEALLGYTYMAILIGLLLNLSQHTMKPQAARNSYSPDRPLTANGQPQEDQLRRQRIPSVLTKEMLETPRGPAELREFVLAFIKASGSDPEERRKAFLKEELYKPFIEEVVPLARCAERLYPPDFKLQPLLGDQGFDALVYNKLGDCVEKVEVTIPHDGNSEKADARLVVDRGVGMIRLLQEEEIAGLVDICIATCEKKAQKDYSDCTLLISLNWVECTLMGPEEHVAFMDALLKRISAIKFRARRVFLYDATLDRLELVSAY